MSTREEEIKRSLPAGWSYRGSTVRFESKIMRLREDRLTVGGNREMTYAFTECGEAVIVVPVTEDGQMVLIRQYRHPVGEQCLEVPAGTTLDAGDLSLEEVTTKELAEEVGAECDRLEHVGSFFSNASMCDEECHVFIAFGTHLTTKPDREPGEEIETLMVPAAQAIEMVHTGQMKNGPVAFAILLAAPRLREAGLLP